MAAADEINAVSALIFDELADNESTTRQLRYLLNDCDGDSANVVKTVIDSDSLSDNSSLFAAAGFLREVHFRPENYAEVYVWNYSDEDFHKLFRMSRDTFSKLLEVLQDDISKEFQGGNIPLSVDKVVLVALWYLAHEEGMVPTGDKINIAVSTVHQCVHVVVKLLERLGPKFIRWPKREEYHQISLDFQQTTGFPGTVGCIDGTHVKVTVPAEKQRGYCDRKLDHSIVLQGVCTNDNLLTDVFVGMGGSAHDARVLRYSPLYNAITNDPTTLFPDDQYHILGDSAYPVLTWLLTPYRDNGHLTGRQQRYNKLLSSNRVKIEHVFGLLKGRFRVLQNMNVNVDNAPRVVFACCVLHNFCLLNDDTLDDYYRSDEPDFPSDDDNLTVLAGLVKRDQICAAL